MPSSWLCQGFGAFSTTERSRGLRGLHVGSFQLLGRSHLCFSFQVSWRTHSEHPKGGLPVLREHLMMPLETFRVRAYLLWNFLCLCHAIAVLPERVREFARALLFRSYCIGNLAK